MLIESVALVWVPLILAIISGFLKQPKVSIGLVATTLLIALVNDRLSSLALLSILVGFIVAYQTPKLNNPFRYAGYTFLIVWSLALSLHIMPGFSNLQVLDKVITGPQSAPFSMYLNLDKPMIFFALLMAYPTLLGKVRTLNLRAVSITVILLFALLPIASAMEVVKPELSLPRWWWLFLLNNLLLTCVAEEAFFRGFLQQSSSERFGWFFGLLGTSILFGAAHFSGGMGLIIFATLAGLGYGLIFHFTGRLWAAVLIHFLFNFAHLVFFTYPALAK